MDFIDRWLCLIYTCKRWDGPEESSICPVSTCLQCRVGAFGGVSKLINHFLSQTVTSEASRPAWGSGHLSMAIPQELIDTIVDNLHDDIPSLKSCALTARTFVRSAQIHIFRRVEITGNPPRDRNSASSTPCQRFYKLLVSSPRIAPLVTDLSIVLVGSETSFEYVEGTAEYPEDRQVPWIMAAGRTLSLVLPLLNLERISLVENGPDDWSPEGQFSMNWNHLGRQLKPALADIFSSPRLEAVHLRGIVVESPYQLLALFSEASALKELSLSRVYFTSRETQLAAWPESRPWRPRLTSLLIYDLSSEPAFVPYLISPQIDLTTIKSLTLSTHTIESKDTILTTANELEHLRLWNVDSSISNSIVSTFTAHLQSVYFRTWNILEFLELFFNVCPRGASLEIVTLEGFDRATEGVTQGLDSPVVHLRSLKMVEIKQVLESSTEFSAWSATVRSLLPSLDARGMLTITQIQFNEFEPYHGWE
ncbi:hypothetical protein C8R46DRAFT_671827 [Mycena filopes]|nr:hypothetical protein C8R46DRAFT_671827 [Mycena filopes]